MGLIADIVEIMKDLKENGEGATPETVIALVAWKEGGKKDGGKEHEQRKSSENA